MQGLRGSSSRAHRRDMEAMGHLIGVCPPRGPGPHPWQRTCPSLTAAQVPPTKALILIDLDYHALEASNGSRGSALCRWVAGLHGLVGLHVKGIGSGNL